jgi:hypothetical protein
LLFLLCFCRGAVPASLLCEYKKLGRETLPLRFKLMLQILEDRRGAHAPTDAHGYHAVFGFAATHFID